MGAGEGVRLSFDLRPASLMLDLDPVSARVDDQVVLDETSDERIAPSEFRDMPVPGSTTAGALPWTQSRRSSAHALRITSQSHEHVAPDHPVLGGAFGGVPIVNWSAP